MRMRLGGIGLPRNCLDSRLSEAAAAPLYWYSLYFGLGPTKVNYLPNADTKLIPILIIQT